MRLLTCIIVAMSIALASAQIVLADPLSGGCPGTAVQADTCQDQLLQRTQTTTSSDSGSKCLGLFLVREEIRLNGVNVHVGAPSQVASFGGSDPKILLRPPRA